jgi:hypothetical protein
VFVVQRKLGWGRLRRRVRRRIVVERRCDLVEQWCDFVEQRCDLVERRG